VSLTLRANRTALPMREYLIDDAAHAWLQARQDEILQAKAQQRKYPVFVVAAAGAAFAPRTGLQVHGRIGDLYAGQFAHHTFGISGVSGGSLGSAAFRGRYLGRQAKRLPQCWNTDAGPLRPWASAVMSQDFLAPVLRRLFYTDLTQRFLPFS